MAQSFTLDIERFARKTKSTLGAAAQAIKIGLFNGLILDTRVDTGRMRGNWQISTGAPIATETDRETQLKKGQPGGAEMDEVLKVVTPYGVDYITNNVPYAPIINEMDGIIDKNLARIDRIARGAVKELKGGKR